MSGNIKKNLYHKQHLELNGNSVNKESGNSSSIFTVKGETNDTQVCLSYDSSNQQLAFSKTDENTNLENNLLSIDRNDGLVTAHNDMNVLNNLKVNNNLEVNQDLTLNGKLNINGNFFIPNNPSESFQKSSLKTGLECGVIVESVKFVNYLCEGFLEIELSKDLPECYSDCRDMVMFQYFSGANASLINGKSFMLRFKESCGTCEDGETDVNRKVIFVPTREMGNVRSGIEAPAINDFNSQQASVYRLRNRDEYLSENETAGLSFFFVDSDHNEDELYTELGNNNNIMSRRVNRGSIFNSKDSSCVNERALIYDIKNDCWVFKGKVKFDSTKELQVNKISNKTDDFDVKGLITLDGPTRISDDLDIEGDLNLDGNFNSNNNELTISLNDGRSYLTLNSDNSVLKSNSDITFDADDDLAIIANNLNLSNLRGDIKINNNTFIMFGLDETNNDPSSYISNVNNNLVLSDCIEENQDSNDQEDIGIQIVSQHRNIVINPQSESANEDDGSVFIKGDIQCNNFFAHGILSHSDVSLKTDISDMEDNVLDKLMKLRPVSYTWKDNQKSDMGLIAQNVESEFPEFVGIDHNGIKGVDYSKIVSVLTKGFQIQQKKINELLIKIDELKSYR